MQFFIDTANIAEIRELAQWGIIDGVTTNPTLLSREEGDPLENLKTICELVNGPVSAEVVALDHQTMVEEARKLAKLHPNITIKVPTTADGLKAIRVLSSEGIKTNATLVFSSNQALLVARAGATFLSPFIGRFDDAGQVGMDLIRELMVIWEHYDLPSKIIVASVRHPLHVVEAALAGAPIATVPPGVLRRMIKHPLTDKGIDAFLADWEKLGVTI